MGRQAGWGELAGETRERRGPRAVASWLCYFYCGDPAGGAVRVGGGRRGVGGDGGSRGERTRGHGGGYSPASKRSGAEHRTGSGIRCARGAVGALGSRPAGRPSPRLHGTAIAQAQQRLLPFTFGNARSHSTSRNRRPRGKSERVRCCCCCPCPRQAPASSSGMSCEPPAFRCGYIHYHHSHARIPCSIPRPAAGSLRPYVARDPHVPAARILLILGRSTKARIVRLHLSMGGGGG